MIWVLKEEHPRGSRRSRGQEPAASATKLRQPSEARRRRSSPDRRQMPQEEVCSHAVQERLDRRADRYGKDARSVPDESSAVPSECECSDGEDKSVHQAVHGMLPPERTLDSRRTHRGAGSDSPACHSSKASRRGHSTDVSKEERPRLMATAASQSHVLATPRPETLAHQEVVFTQPAAPKLAYPKPEYLTCTCRHFDTRTEYPITTEKAVCVQVKANVLEIRSVDDTAEKFSAVFTVHFRWIDPSLWKFADDVWFWQGDDIRRGRGTVVHHPGYNGHTQFTIRMKVASKSKDAGDEPIEEVVEVPQTCFIGMRQPRWDKEPWLFLPKWSFLNTFEEEPIILTKDRRLLYVSELGGHVFDKYKFHGKFSQKLKLHRFPFDRQEFKIKITSEQTIDRMQWQTVEKRAGDGFKSIGCPPEWRLDGKLPELIVKEPGKSWQRFEVSVFLVRNPEFFLWNVVVMMFIFCSGSFVASFLDPGKVAERSTITLTVLLITAGYRHMISQWVPRRPYNTRLDWYTFAGFFLQLLTMLESVVVAWWLCESVNDSDGEVDGRFHSRSSDSLYRTPPDMECAEVAAEIDKWFFRVAFGCWACAHIIALVAAKVHGFFSGSGQKSDA